MINIYLYLNFSPIVAHKFIILILHPVVLHYFINFASTTNILHITSYRFYDEDAFSEKIFCGGQERSLYFLR